MTTTPQPDVIERVEVLVTSPGRNFVTLRLTTRDGLVGLGDATVNGRELAVAAYLRDHLAEILLGRPADRIEDTWQYLYRGAYWRPGAVGMAAVGAVDMALWDIKAKRAGMPLYQLLGGASRDWCLTYAHAFGADVPALVDSIRALVDRGFRAVRVQFAVPEHGPGYGVATGSTYEPATRGARPAEEVWSAAEYLRQAPRVLAAVREEVGEDLHLLHDVHHRLTATQAARLGRDLEPHRLFWLEDVVPMRDQHALDQVRAHTTTPIAMGEVATHLDDVRPMLERRLIDYVRATATHAGGVTHLRRIMDFAAAYGVRSGCHGPSDISPVGLAAALHVGMAIPNFGIQEYMGHTAQTQEVFRPSYTLHDGALHPGDEPGLGVDLDTVAAARHEYVPAYLPVNRLVDGTMHDW